MMDDGRKTKRIRSVKDLKVYKLAFEAAETQAWLEFSLACKYIDRKTFERLDENYEHVFAMLSTMERKADSFCNVQ